MDETLPDRGQVRTAEVIAALSLATDLAMGVRFEYGLRSTLVAMRLCESLEVDPEIASQTYFHCLLFYVGCTAPADVGFDVFGERRRPDDICDPSSLRVQGGGNKGHDARGGARRLGRCPCVPGRSPAGLPRLALGFPGVVAATCEVARMLTERLGLSAAVSQLFAYEGERWDGKGLPDGVGEEQIPLPVRIVHVARDAAFQQMLGDEEFVAAVIAQQGGRGIRPDHRRAVIEGGRGDPRRGSEGLCLGVDYWRRSQSHGGCWRGRRSTRRWPRWVTSRTSPFHIMVGHSGGVARVGSAAARVVGIRCWEAGDLPPCRAGA